MNTCQRLIFLFSNEGP